MLFFILSSDRLFKTYGYLTGFIVFLAVFAEMWVIRQGTMVL